jgi:hypothetical protein
MIVTYNFNQFGGTKAAIGLGIPGRIYRFLGPVAFITACYYRNRFFMTLTFLGLIAHLLMFQMRSPIAFALLSFLFLVARRKKLSVSDRIKYISFGVLSGLSIIFFDKVKDQLLRGDFNHLLQVEQIFNQIIWYNNGHNIFLILNKTLETDYRLSDPIYHLAVNLLQIIPLGRTVLGFPYQHYGHKFKLDHFPGREAGIASNIWAEGYALAGVAGLIFLLAGFFFIISIINGLLRSSCPPLRIYALVVFPYVGFYIHRMTIGAILNVMMIFIVFVFGPWLVLLAIRNFQSTSRRPSGVGE